MSTAVPLLEIRGLTLAFGADPAAAPVLDDVSINLRAGEIVGVVGESGSGKTMAARSVLRLWPAGARLRAGQVLLDGQDLLALPEERIRDVRGARIGMIFQEPMTSLNPALKVGFQLEEGLRRHTRLDRHEIRARVLAMLAELGMPDPPGSLNRHPHEFSGGMRQRLMIASAMCLRPQLLIADEPTTALDAIIARQVLEAMVAATRSAGTAVLLVSHDLSAVCHYAERIVVMRHGRVVETGTTERILLHPEHEYTRALLDALPRRRSKPRAQTTEQLVAQVEDLRVRYAARGAWPWSPPPAPVLNGVSLEIRRGETLAVVGESGSGKSTLGRAVLGLLPACGGKVTLLGQSIEPGARLALELRRRAQLVFQDPYAALDPRMRVAALVAEGLRHVAGLDARERKLRVTRMLDEVGLEARFAKRYPHELSGGQRQRVVIARALVTEPDLIVADEPVSALDVTVQAQVLALLERLQQRFGFAMLFVSHDLSVVGQVADRIAIVRGGRVLEHGHAAAILDQPTHPYTRELWSAAPRLAPVDDGFRLAAANPPPAAAPAGYRFAEASDADAAVTVLRIAPGHEVLCVAAA